MPFTSAIWRDEPTKLSKAVAVVADMLSPVAKNTIKSKFRHDKRIVPVGITF